MLLSWTMFTLATEILREVPLQREPDGTAATDLHNLIADELSKDGPGTCSQYAIKTDSSNNLELEIELVSARALLGLEEIPKLKIVVAHNGRGGLDGFVHYFFDQGGEHQQQATIHTEQLGKYYYQGFKAKAEAEAKKAGRETERRRLDDLANARPITR